MKSFISFFQPLVKNNLDLVFVGIVMTLLYYATPYLTSFQNNSDEGFNLAKSMLLSRGNLLYVDIWSDQPPLLTILLSYWMRVFGENIEVARNLIYLFSILLVFSLARILKLLWGSATAIVGCVLLIFSPSYIFLSTSIMIGLPAISLATFAMLQMLYWHQSKKKIYLVLAGSSLALGVLTKLFCLLLLPIFLIGILLATFQSKSINKSSLILSPLVLLFAYLLTTMVFSWQYWHTEILSQIFAPHLLARKVDFYQNTLTASLQKHISSYWIYIVGAIFGGILGLIKGQRLNNYLLVWCLVAITALFFHRPIWFHHMLLVVVPATMLTAVFITHVASWIISKIFLPKRHSLMNQRLTLLLAIVVCTYFAMDAVSTKRSVQRQNNQFKIENKIVNYLKSTKTEQAQIFTDLPIFAFHSGVPPLPALTVISEKRLRSGSLSEEQIKQELIKANPEYILLGRFELTDLRDFIETHYVKIHNSAHYRFFARQQTFPEITCKFLVDCLNQPPIWYLTEPAKQIADKIVINQNSDGGWRKDIELEASLDEGMVRKHNLKSTIDNYATTQEIQFLARIAQVDPKESYLRAINQGIVFLLSNQYPNGGWAQSYPISHNYTSAVTFNDHAIINVLRLFQDINNKLEFQMVPEELQSKIERSLQQGIRLILNTQLTINGKKTAWCAQYNPKTLEPVAARTYEPASISGYESVEIVRFLMNLPEQTSEIKAAINAALDWFQASALSNLLMTVGPQGEIEVSAKKDAPPIWARFYDLETNLPLLQDRDGTFKNNFSELSAERSQGYGYYTYAPSKLLLKDYPNWQNQ